MYSNKTGKLHKYWFEIANISSVTSIFAIYLNYFLIFRDTPILAKCCFYVAYISVKVIKIYGDLCMYICTLKQYAKIYIFIFLNKKLTYFLDILEN